MGTLIRLSYGDSYVSQNDYPAGQIQGGVKGLVISPKGNYRTAFIEFFPETGGFIRGEGKTLEEADAALMAKLANEAGCVEHEYIPKGYTNGAGFCKHCNQFKSQAFTAVELGQFCYQCGIPTGIESGRKLADGFVFVCDDHDELKPYADCFTFVALDYEGEFDDEFVDYVDKLRNIVYFGAGLDVDVLEFFKKKRALEQDFEA